MFVNEYARLSFSQFVRRENKFRNLPIGDQNSISLYIILEIRNLTEKEDKIRQSELVDNFREALLKADLSVKTIFLGLKKILTNKEFYRKHIPSTPIDFIAICKDENSKPFLVKPKNMNYNVPEMAGKYIGRPIMEKLRNALSLSPS